MEAFEVVVMSDINVRAGVTDAFEVVDHVGKGEYVTVLETKFDEGKNKWYRIDKGWINAAYTKFESAIDDAVLPRVTGFSNASFGSSGFKLSVDQSSLTGLIGSSNSINSGVLGSLTSGLGTDAQEAILSRRIFGTPHQFLESTDMRPDSNSPLGYEFATNIMSETPIISIMPGIPNYLAEMDAKEKTTLTNRLINGINGATNQIQGMTKDLIEDDAKLDTKFFDFRCATTEYMLYSNLLCRMCAVYMGLGNTPVPGGAAGDTYGNYNWFKWRLSNAYNNRSTQLGDLSDAFTQVKDAFSKGIKGLFGSGDKGPGEGESSGGSSDDGLVKIWKEMNGISAASNNGWYADTYYVDFFIKPPSYSESFSNQTKASALADSLQSASGMAKEMAFIFAGAGTDFAKNSQENIAKFEQEMSAKIPSLVNDSGMQTMLNRLVTGSTSVITGANLIFPEVWEGSSYDRDFQVDITLTTPYGDPESIFLNIMVPYMHLLAFVLPRQASVNSYTSPFIVRACVPGFFNCDMGIVRSLSVQKGGDGTAWSVHGLPTEITISMSIADLYKALSMSNFKTPRNIYNMLYNTELYDFIGVNCGANMRSSDYQKKLELLASLTGNVINDQIDFSMGSLRQSMATSASKILAGKG